MLCVGASNANWLRTFHGHLVQQVEEVRQLAGQPETGAATALARRNMETPVAAKETMADESSVRRQRLIKQPSA
jgi:hypothetical protein